MVRNPPIPSLREGCAKTQKVSIGMSNESPPPKSPSPIGEGIGVRPWGRGGVSDIKEVVMGANRLLLT